MSSSKILDEDRGNGDLCSERQTRRVAPVEAPEQQVLVLVVGTGTEPSGILELSLGEPHFPVETAEPAGVLGTGSKTLQIQPEISLAGERREHPQRALAAERSEFAPVLVRSVDPTPAEHLWGGQALTPASYRHEQRASRERNPQPRRTLAALPSGAHDSGDAAPNTTHEADDNTNSKVERPWGRSPPSSVPSSRTPQRPAQWTARWTQVAIGSGLQRIHADHLPAEKTTLLAADSA